MNQAYRCSSGHHLAGQTRESSKFLSGPHERAMVAQYLSYPSPILEVFNRPAILSRYQSRFGPLGFRRNPLYVASDIDTTFYEFGFHLLNSKAIQDQEIKITCFNLTVHLQGIIEDPRNDPNVANILSSSTTYNAAHNWLKSLPAPPDIIIYPSVRHPFPNLPEVGLNYAIYERNNVNVISGQNQLLMRLDNHKRCFSVYDQLSTQISTLTPKSSS